MKTSRYNFSSDLNDGSILLYNSISGSLIKITADEYKRCLDLLPMLKSDNNIVGLLDQLKQGHFIVDDDLDEFNYIKFLHYIARYSSGIYHLEIAPSGDCNFACSYCFNEDHEYVSMSREVEYKLLEKAETEIRGKKKLNVSWIGGEPTLAVDTLCRLSKGFMDITAKENAIYTSAIFTNGYLLNREMAVRLKQHKVQMAQITIDGPPEIHNKRRPLKNGGGTFDVILNNIREISDVLKVILRVNIDRTNANAETITQILDLVEKAGIPKHVFIDLEEVQPYTAACSCYAAMYGFDRREYAQVITDLIPLIQSRGYDFLVQGKTLLPKVSACPSCSIDCLAISSDGDICKCLTLVGNKRESLGNLLNPGRIDDRMIKWLAWDPFARRECRECTVLPLCMGGDGCPFPEASLEGNVRRCELRCSPFKFRMKEILKMYYESIQRKRTESIVNIYNAKKINIISEYSVGDECVDISRVKEILKIAGYDTGTIDYKFDEITANTLIKFQSDRHLNMSGMLDIKTQETLNNLLETHLLNAYFPANYYGL